MGDPKTWCIVSVKKLFNFFLLLFNMILIFVLLVCFLVIVHPKLKSRYKVWVEVTFDYVKTIDDFDNIVDPVHCLSFPRT